ncbi:hypothetical protein CAPTEDRAFT_201673 [Capitella teleta]|uniref:G-protein coupled receptors family 1 profile domain-containing protein n=1 Tax=Capitella teleta TaxID=283909 RepID=R7T4W6_CAPTE|nr:hypothetical protein CAPTEDRAFT_201673 [Capitella teleta]|eukprot:ELT87966.1 hypothetical protein CAPTEDRAFT_201673 [Capitella teleta]
MAFILALMAFAASGLLGNSTTIVIILTDTSLRCRPQAFLLVNFAILDFINISVESCIRISQFFEVEIAVSTKQLSTWTFGYLLASFFLLACLAYYRYIVVCKQQCRALKRLRTFEGLSLSMVTWSLVLSVTAWASIRKDSLSHVICQNETNLEPLGSVNGVVMDGMVLFLCSIASTCIIALQVKIFVQLRKMRFCTDPAKAFHINALTSKRVHRERIVCQMFLSITALKMTATWPLVVQVVQVYLQTPSSVITCSIASTTNVLSCCCIPLIYVACSSRFRAACKRMLSKLRHIQCRCCLVQVTPEREANRKQSEVFCGHPIELVNVQALRDLPVNESQRRISTYDGQAFFVINLQHPDEMNKTQAWTKRSSNSDTPSSRLSLPSVELP